MAVTVGVGVEAVAVVAAVAAVPDGLPVPAGAEPPEDDFVVDPGSAGAAEFVPAGLLAATVSVGVGAVGFGAAVCVLVASADAVVFSPVAPLSSDELARKNATPPAAASPTTMPTMSPTGLFFGGGGGIEIIALAM